MSPILTTLFSARESEVSIATIEMLRISIVESSEAHAHRLEVAKAHYTAQIEKLDVCFAKVRPKSWKRPATCQTLLRALRLIRRSRILNQEKSKQQRRSMKQDCAHWRIALRKYTRMSQVSPIRLHRPI